MWQATKVAGLRFKLGNPWITDYKSYTLTAPLAGPAQALLGIEDILLVLSCTGSYMTVEKKRIMVSANMLATQM